uniref:reverse transcriptase n=1 Tax=Cyathus jiayuguanensis TaxID=380660 RepID=UPI0023F1FF6A
APFNYLVRCYWACLIIGTCLITYPVEKDCKGTGLSDGESLGECSMPVKADWKQDLLLKNIRQPTSVMVYLIKVFWVNTTLALSKIYKDHLAILFKDQLSSISTARRSPQHARQTLKPKTEKDALTKNWGFPKGSNSYRLTRESGYLSKLLRCGNGASVVLRNEKGKQFIFAKSPFSDNPLQRNYTTKAGKAEELEVKREIECSYNQLFIVDIFKSAYQKLRSKPGNMTPGVDKENLDGISLDWANKTIEKLKDRTFQFKPSSRVFIPKSNGEMRALGVPTPKDKIIQQAIRLIFESIYEPIFKNSSHGFRPNRSTTTAIFEVRKWNGITWMIEGDIKGFFDNIDHKLLAELLKTKIKDTNLINLYWKLVKAGYINDGHFEKNGLGVPPSPRRGGVLSPLLSNIFLHEFDLFMEKLINKYTNNEKRVSKANPEYEKLRRQIRKITKEPLLELEQKQNLIQLNKKLRFTPSVLRDDTTGTRVYYNRYADDWVIGVSGSLKLANTIKKEVQSFLIDTLKLSLSEEKTKITSMTKDKASYLGFLLSRRSRKYTESLISYVKSTGRTRRASQSSLIIEAPIEKILNKLVDQNFAIREKDLKLTPKAITKWIFLTPQEIILKYNAVLGGILRYYYFVENRNQLSYIVWILTYSAVFTLARKLRLSPKKVFKKFGNPITVKYNDKEKTKSISLLKPNTLGRDRSIKIDSYFDIDPFKVKYFSVRTHHSWDEICKICSSDFRVEMHHTKHIKKSKVPSLGSGFTQLMRQLNRKQIPVCKSCHDKIHAGKYDGISLKK